MLATLPASIRRLIDEGIRTISPDRVILFGSRARGDARQDSDFDIAFDFPPGKRRAWLRFVSESADQPLTLLPTDMVDWHEASPELQASICREGISLYERSEHPS
jgi:predicted nucleotidyltransferase